MFKINEIAYYLLQKYPLINQEEWDNCGLFFNIFNPNCQNIVVGLDVTHELINIAKNNNANLIITHHPIYLNDNKEINPDKKEILDLLKTNHISYLCLHTCFDKASDGTSFQIIKRLPFIKNIIQNSSCNYIFSAELEKPIKLIDYVNAININNFSQQPIIYDDCLKNKIITNISVCAGSGSFFVHEAIFNSNIDCYLCGDIKWHDWLDANDNKFPLIDINHAAEAVFIEHISELIQKNFNINVVKVFPNLKLVQKINQ